MRFATYFTLIFIAITFFNCAGSYKQIVPEVVPYAQTQIDSTISFSYQYDVLSLRRNRRYAKKERKKDIRVVAVKITNHSDSTIHLSRNTAWQVGGQEVVPVVPIVVGREIKQTVPTYLLFSLLTFQTTKTEMSSQGPVTTRGPVIPIGAPIALGNVLVAANANTNFRKELARYDLTNKEIAPGKTVYGIVSFRSSSYEPIKLVVKPATTALK